MGHPAASCKVCVTVRVEMFLHGSLAQRHSFTTKHNTGVRVLTTPAQKWTESSMQCCMHFAHQQNVIMRLLQIAFF